MEKTKIIIATIFKALLYVVGIIIVTIIASLIINNYCYSELPSIITRIICLIIGSFIVILVAINGEHEIKLLNAEELLPVLIQEKDKNKRIEIIDEIKNLLKSKKPNIRAVSLKNTIYQKFLAEIIHDVKITNDEKETLIYLEESFELDSYTIRNNRRDAYLIAYNWAIEDRKLTEHEENILRSIFMQLNIDPDDVENEQAFLKDLSLARQLAGKELNPIRMPFSLKQNEQCYFSIDNVYLYKSRKKNYEYQREKNPEFEGKLYITNQRIIINDPGKYNRNLISEIDMVSIHEDCFIKLFFKRRNNVEFLEVSKPYLTEVIILNYLNKVRS